MIDSKEKQKKNYDLDKNKYSINDMETWEYWANEQQGIRGIGRQVIVKIVRNGEFILLGAFINLFVDLAFLSIHSKWFEISTGTAGGTIFTGNFRGNSIIGLSVCTGLIMAVSFITVEVKSSEMVVALLKKIFVIVMSFNFGTLILISPWHNNYLLFILMCILTLIGSCLIAQIIIILIRSTVSYVKKPVDNEAVLKKMNFIWIVIAAMIGWILKK